MIVQMQGNTAQGSTQASASAAVAFERLVDVIATLRGENGCPWDREQTHESIARNMLEEAHEAVEAIREGESQMLVEELGDVLLQVMLHAQIAADEGEFTIEDVVNGLIEKMIRRHPHVFGDEALFAAAHLAPEEIAEIEAVRTPGDVEFIWDYIKVREKRQKAGLRRASALARGVSPDERSLLDDVPKSLPALMQAQDISRKAVSYGFEWETVDDVWEKVGEEIGEYRAALADSDGAHAQMEFGDILFTLVNVARKGKIDAEAALLDSCGKFRDRWRAMERYARDDEVDLSACGIDVLEAYWQRAKRSDA